MHRALQINEILRMVFELFQVEGKEKSNQKENRRTLATAAVVCRAFRDVSLDVLWRYLHGLLPLLSILPTENRGPNLIIAPGNISDYLWARFDLYAVRVRTFNSCETLYDAMNSPNIHHSVYIRLAQARPCIFPQLNKLHVSQATDNTTMELMLCLSNTVRGFRFTHIDWSDSRYHVGTVLDTIASYENPGIERLIMCVTLSQSYVERLLPLRNLRKLYFLGVSSVEDTSDILQKLSTLPKLEEMCLRLSDNASIEPIPSTGFPSLWKLRLPNSPKASTILLNALPRNRIRHIDVKDTREWGDVLSALRLRLVWNDWDHCFTSIALHTCLKRINVMIESDHVDDDILDECKDIRYISVIHYLLSIPSIEDFALLGAHGMPLSDNDVFKIASAWPLLKGIDFGYKVASEKPSFLALQHIAALCPKLQKLRISFDSTKDVPVLSDPPTPSHPLEELRLGLTDVTASQFDVRRLRSLFPNLKGLTSQGDDDDETKVLTDLLLSNTP